MSEYDDILHLPHHQSRRHPQMPLADRAAQFSPFAALTGYEAAVQETARLTDQQVELDESQQAALNETLCRLLAGLDQQPEVTLTYFVPDEKKAGGAYVSVTGQLKKLDEYQRLLIFSDGTQVPLDLVIQLEG